MRASLLLRIMAALCAVAVVWPAAAEEPARSPLAARISSARTCWLAGANVFQVHERLVVVARVWSVDDYLWTHPPPTRRSPVPPPALTLDCLVGVGASDDEKAQALQDLKGVQVALVLRDAKLNQCTWNLLSAEQIAQQGVDAQAATAQTGPCEELLVKGVDALGVSAAKKRPLFELALGLTPSKH